MVPLVVTSYEVPLTLGHWTSDLTGVGEGVERGVVGVGVGGMLGFVRHGWAGVTERGVPGRELSEELFDSLEFGCCVGETALGGAETCTETDDEEEEDEGEAEKDEGDAAFDVEDCGTSWGGCRCCVFGEGRGLVGERGLLWVGRVLRDWLFERNLVKARRDLGLLVIHDRGLSKCQQRGLMIRY